MFNTNEELTKLYPEILKKLSLAKTNHSFFCTNFLKIITKECSLKPFILNNIQLDFLNFLNKTRQKNKNIRKVIILKARQFGMSTFIESYLFNKILFNRGKRAFVMAHQQQSTDSIFNITNIFYKYLPEFLQQIYPKQIGNFKEINIKYNESSIKIGTAGGKDVGRGTTNNYIHCSEVAFWDKPEIILSSLMETMADEGDNLATYESTANGYNFFKDEFEKGLTNNDNTVSIFYGWNKFTDYRKPIDYNEDIKTKEDFIVTMTEEEINLAKIYKLSLEQINWRRNKIKISFEGREQLFKQEYPLIWQEAFINSLTAPLIEYDKIYEARNNNLKENELEPIIAGIVMWLEQAMIELLLPLEEEESY